MAQNGSSTYWTATDKLGSVRAHMGTAQGFQWHTPYAEVTTTEGTWAGLRYGWTGRESDAETGFYYLRARYYDPKQRRFTQEDPIGEAGGPNRYAYVGGAVLEARDPSGLYGDYDFFGGNPHDWSGVPGLNPDGSGAGMYEPDYGSELEAIMGLGGVISQAAFWSPFSLHPKGGTPEQDSIRTCTQQSYWCRRMYEEVVAEVGPNGFRLEFVMTMPNIGSCPSYSGGCAAMWPERGPLAKAAIYMVLADLPGLAAKYRIPVTFATVFGHELGHVYGRMLNYWMESPCGDLPEPGRPWGCGVMYENMVRDELGIARRTRR